jgi:hypothetical protein
MRKSGVRVSLGDASQIENSMNPKIPEPEVGGGGPAPLGTSIVQRKTPPPPSIWRPLRRPAEIDFYTSRHAPPLHQAAWPQICTAVALPLPHRQS